MFQSERENKDFAFNFSNFSLHNASKALHIEYEINL